MPVTDDARLRELLQADRIVVVGASTTPGKAAHAVPAYLMAAGYDIVPVNPHAERVLGEPAHDTLTDVDGPIDVVQVFRPSEEVPGIIDEAIDRGDVSTVWLQSGIADDAAANRAEAAGMTVVQDRCMRADHRRLMVA